MWIQAGPLLSSFLMLQGVESPGGRIPDTLPLTLALVGLLLTVLLRLRTR